MFFTQMYQMMNQSIDITLVVRKKEGQLMVSVLPKSNGLKDEAQNHIVPITMTGTPQELDMGFMQGICQPIQKAAGLLTNMKLFEEQAEKAAANSKATKEQKDKAAKEAKEKKEKFDKLMKKADELEAEQKLNDAMNTLKQAKAIATTDAIKGVDEKINALRMKMSQGSLFAMEEPPQRQQVANTQQQVVQPTVTTQQPVQQTGMNGYVVQNGNPPVQQQQTVQTAASQPAQQSVPQNMNGNGQYMQYSSAINGQQSFYPQPPAEVNVDIEPQPVFTADYSAHREGEYDQYPDFPGYSNNNMYNPQNV